MGNTSAPQPERSGSKCAKINALTKHIKITVFD